MCHYCKCGGASRSAVEDHERQCSGCLKQWKRLRRGDRIKLGNRPLTLEELKAHCAKGRDAEPLWVEFDTVSDMALWVLANTPCGMDEKDIPSLAYWLKDEELVSEYGKFWRCWPRKPTPEQMAAEKWEE